MAKTGGRVLGHAPCPYCGSAGAEVKQDKNAHPYIICFDCGDGESPSQHWTRGHPKKIAALLGGGKFKPLTGAELPEWAVALQAPPPGPTKDKAPPPPAPRKSTVLG